MRIDTVNTILGTEESEEPTQPVELRSPQETIHSELEKMSPRSCLDRTVIVVTSDIVTRSHLVRAGQVLEGEVVSER